ncbi:MAG: hypothetical protein M1816_003065 [Peltula sp. TS41687]|nr:MAG: hypothetical protein M1816_003065 [Peltula sp. TS41687]
MGVVGLEKGPARMDRNGRWTPTSWLRIVTSFLSVVGIAVLGSSAREEADPNGGAGYSIRAFVDVLVVVALSCGALWNIMDLIVICARGRPMPPGASVALHLLIGLFLATASTLCTIVVNNHFRAWSRADPEWSRELIGITIADIVLVLHIVLFVFACRDTYLERRRAKQMEAELTGMRLEENGDRSVVMCDHCHEQLFEGRRHHHQ